MRRRVWFWIFLSVGVTLMVVSYFWLTAPWGATSEVNSQPRMEFSPALFVLGVMFAFGSAVVYELLPDESDQELVSERMTAEGADADIRASSFGRP